MAETKPVIEIPLRLERLFLHFFDIHFLEDKGRVAQSKPFQNEMRLATRLAVASADRVLIPAASYFESPICRQIVDGLDELVSLGFIMLVGSSTNLEEFVRERQDESFYRKGSLQHDSYREELNLEVIPAYQRRYRSTTRDIVDSWGRKVEADDLQRMLRDASELTMPNLDSRLERVPSELGTLAFIPEHVYEILDIHAGSSIERARIRSAINEAYFDSYVRELDAGVVVDLSYLASDFKLPSYGRNLSYQRMLRFLMAEGQVRTVAECSQQQLVALGNHPAWRQVLQANVTYVQPTNPRRPNVAPMRQAQATVDLLPLPHSVLCVAAAAVEFATVRRQFDDLFGVGKIISLNADRSDYAVEYTDTSTGTRWNLVSLAFQGQVEAASRVSNLSSALHPTIILMVGMCMGMPKRNYPIGTVIVPNEVISFDHQRLTSEGTQYRPHGERVANGLYMLARLIGHEPKGYKVVADKGLASASTKIEDPHGELVKFIEQVLPDVAAFDMEGGGFYRAGHGKECLWIKAVADSGESQVATSAGQVSKHETQSNVTTNATDFAVRLVRQYVSSNGQGFSGF